MHELDLGAARSGDWQHGGSRAIDSVRLRESLDAHVDPDHPHAPKVWGS